MKTTSSIVSALGIAVLTAVPVLLLAGSYGFTEEASPGEKVYRAQCATCHGDDGKGDTRMGKVVQTPDITQTPWKHGTSQEDVEKIVRDGSGKMPGYKSRLTEEQIRLVSEFTRVLTGVDKE